MVPFRLVGPLGLSQSPRMLNWCDAPGSSWRKLLNCCPADLALLDMQEGKRAPSKGQAFGILDLEP